MLYFDVTAHETRRGTVTIVGIPKDRRTVRGTVRVFRAGCASIDHAKQWLRDHAPNGWIWRYPDGSRVLVTIAQAAHERVIARYEPVFSALAAIHDRAHDVALALANSI